MGCKEKMKKIMDMIDIPGADAIRGNITLPESVAGIRVSWKSSNTDVITDRSCGSKKAGVVTRQSEDCKVTLTAEVSFDGEKAKAVKAIEVCVIKAPVPVTEDDYEGYLFGHFIGEDDENGEQIYFALSDDTLMFKDMNGGRPVLTSNIGEKGVRDPYLCRSAEGDRFFIVATDLSIFHRGGWIQNEQGYYDASTTGSRSLVFWESTDLVNWSRARLIDVAPENAGMAWAPEMVYDDETGEYVIFFASSIMDPYTRMKSKPNAIYYVTTRDFVHFSDTGIFIDNQADNEENGHNREIIDTTVLKIGDTYYSASKDGDNAEPNGGIRIMRSRHLLDADSWEKVLDLDELKLDVSGLDVDVLDNTSLEGPELFRLNRKDWSSPEVPEYGLIADRYNAGGGYLPIVTTDIEDADNSGKSWRLLTKEEYSFDKLKKRHGTILRITKEEVKRIREAYPM